MKEFLLFSHIIRLFVQYVCIKIIHGDYYCILESFWSGYFRMVWQQAQMCPALKLQSLLRNHHFCQFCSQHLLLSAGLLTILAGQDDHCQNAVQIKRGFFHIFRSKWPAYGSGWSGRSHGDGTDIHRSEKCWKTACPVLICCHQVSAALICTALL